MDEEKEQAGGEERTEKEKLGWGDGWVVCEEKFDEELLETDLENCEEGVDVAEIRGGGVEWNSVGLLFY